MYLSRTIEDAQSIGFIAYLAWEIALVTAYKH